MSNEDLSWHMRDSTFAFCVWVVWVYCDCEHFPRHFQWV